jgi:hypothetical protein
MPESLTLNYNGIAVTGQKVDGRISFSIDAPAASSSDPQAALDWTKLLGQAAKLIPLIASILTGGFTPALIPVIVQTIAELLGLSQSEAQAMFSTQLEAQS